MWARGTVAVACCKWEQHGTRPFMPFQGRMWDGVLPAQCFGLQLHERRWLSNLLHTATPTPPVPSVVLPMGTPRVKRLACSRRLSTSVSSVSATPRSATVSEGYMFHMWPIVFLGDAY